MKILILGSGGREHALGWALRQEDPSVELLFCPGNGGTRAIGRHLETSLDDLRGLVQAARDEQVAFTLVGPEAPLVAGVVDAFRAASLPIFGPSARAALIEGSKVFSKTLMRENGVPTPAFDVFADAAAARRSLRNGFWPRVLKADGLAAGKGVIIAQTRGEAEAAIHAIMEERRFGAAGDQLLIESWREGEEVSAFAIARGEEFRMLPLAQDHKRIGEGDTGPNTGGMGAYAPYPRSSPAFLRAVEEEVFAPVLRALARGDRPFHGLLYAGLMVVHGRPMVLEFNCRFGDPETQAVAPLLGAGLLDAMRAVATGEGALPAVELRAGAAATVVLASAGYPENYRTGYPIEGLDRADELPETFVFHAGTRHQGRRTVTSGGRVLSVTGRGAELRDALRRAYEGCSVIEFEGKTLRRDIGRKGLA